MSVTVLGMGSLYIEDWDLARRIYHDMVEFNQEQTEFFDLYFDADNNTITFDLMGNGGVDYAEITKVCNDLRSKGAIFECEVSEYRETCSGGFSMENKRKSAK